jgi:NADH:ubiquinone reductase (non-electrogenic)
MSEQPTKICILGGGFGGLYTALRLSQFPWQPMAKPEITLIDKNDRFLFSPLLYELVTDELKTWEIAPPFEEVLGGTGVKFQQGWVKSIDVEQKQVQLEDSSAVDYDKLVIALGADTPTGIVPGADEYGIPFRSLADAYRLEEKLRLLEASDKDPIRIAIVGGGYIGVELACKLADRLGQRGKLRIIEMADEILRLSTEHNRQVALKALESRQIWIDTNTKVENIGEDTLTLLYKGQSEAIPVDLVMWTVGITFSSLVKALPLGKNKLGQLVVSPMLQVEDQSDIFALGDVADCRDVQGQILPSTAQAAFQQSDYCAWNLWASLTGRPLLPLRYQQLGEIMSLGKNDAAVTSMGMKLSGYPAYLLRRLVYLGRMPSTDHRLSVGMNWITSPLVEMMK